MTQGFSLTSRGYFWVVTDLVSEHKDMNTERSTARTEEVGIASERIPPRVDQLKCLQNLKSLKCPKCLICLKLLLLKGDMTYAKLRASLMNLTKLMTAQSHVINNLFVAQINQGVGPQPNASSPASKIWDFLRMNPPTFHGTMVDEDPQGLIDEFFKLVDAMGVTPRENADLAAYQLKDVAQESKIREIRQEDKKPRSDDSSHKKHKKRFYHQDSSMGNKDRAPNQHSQGGGHTFERTRCTTCVKQHLGKCLSGMDGCFSCGSKGQNMRDFPRIKSSGKVVNQDSLDPNAPKKNPSYGMGARKDN
ncbi:hypothetical protein EJD97_016155 [Solanum chilense]|uniref:Retrotransposon gag domain-containing protein n=1 Tax=Solanum chilense TaxID=4083 RepID=A0A6N2C718_SOLCI|nr:hypothetical protein EJD97_016155 [Solanum chilense]